MTDRLQVALAAFDDVNRLDPNTIRVDGEEQPKELVQSERRSVWIERLDSNASEALRLAARCQHLRRWEIPRSTYPEGRRGYLEWRAALAKFHAARAREILEQAGYDPATVEQVNRINLKRGLRTDADTQTMEDALCLSFLEHEIDEFAAKHDEAKLVDILRKTWRKMSPRAHELALGLELSPAVAALVRQALEADG